MIALLVALGTLAHTQAPTLSSEAAPLLTPEAARDLALRQNLSFQGQGLTRESAAEQVRAARGALLPSLALTSTLTRIGPNLAGDAPTGNPAITGSPDLQWSNALQARLPLLNLSAWNQLAALKSQDKAAAIRLSGQDNTLALQVDQAYFEVVRQELSQASRRRTLELSRLRTTVARERQRLGAATVLDVRQAQLSLNSDSSALLSGELSLQGSRRTLNALLSRDPSTPFSVIDTIPVPIPGSREDLHARTLANSPGLAELQARRESQDATLRAATATQLLPTLDAFANYQFLNRWHDQNPPNDRAWQGFAFGLQLTYPLFTGGAPTAQRSLASLQSRQLELSLRDSTLQLERAFAQTWSQWELACQSLALEEVNLSLADSTQSLAMEQFRIGGITGLDLRTYQETAQQARLRELSARASARTAAKLLEFLAAKLD